MVLKLLKKRFNNHHLKCWLLNVKLNTHLFIAHAQSLHFTDYLHLEIKQHILVYTLLSLRYFPSAVFELLLLYTSRFLALSKERDRKITRYSGRCRVFTKTSEKKPLSHGLHISEWHSSSIPCIRSASDDQHLLVRKGTAADWHQRWTLTKTVYESYCGKIDLCWSQ